MVAAAERVLTSCRFILGPEVAALESELASLCGTRHGIGVNSGTDALVLALKAVGVKPGDEVITPSFSFVASASAVVMVHATPVFVDIDPVTYNLEPALVARAVTPRTRAIVAVHLYGQPGRGGSPSSRTRRRPWAPRTQAGRPERGETSPASPSTRPRTWVAAATAACC